MSRVREFEQEITKKSFRFGLCFCQLMLFQEDYKLIKSFKKTNYNAIHVYKNT